MISHIKYITFFCFLLSSISLTSYFIKTTESDGIPETNTIVSKTPISLNKEEVVSNFLNLLSATDDLALSKSIAYIDLNWEESYEIMLIESLYFTQNRRFGNKILRLLEKKTSKNYGYDFDKWFHWVWDKDAAYSDAYYEFKAKSHSLIDTKFRRYFENRANQSTIRLDEVRWGGVLQDGIPPLRGPEMIRIEEATYLKDNNVVFGIEVNGDARAYPKRILAWHEMFVDTVGDVPVAGVYCTLCGTVILYKTEHKGTDHAMGTSGFLYRSNKLMYDKATQSLWSTLDGEPVIGPLVGKGIKLDYLSVVTTTWKEWKERHPDTKVLSLNTGHRRDYGEGVAYQQYFATDDLMFTVPKIDKSLKNKDEILAIRLPNISDNYAISSKYLRKKPIYESKIGTVNYVVFTDKTGAHRVYKSKNLRFKSYDRKSTAVDQNGVQWSLTEEGMNSTTGKTLERFPSHNAFWFGYKAAYPDVQLIR